jgi:hypothetical protein
VVIVPLSLLATAILIGGWDVRESAFVTRFGFVGVSPSDALVLSVLFGLLNLLVRLPGALVLLTVRRYGERSFLHARRATEILQRPVGQRPEF